MQSPSFEQAEPPYVHAQEHAWGLELDAWVQVEDSRQQALRYWLMKDLRSGCHDSESCELQRSPEDVWARY